MVPKAKRIARPVTLCIDVGGSDVKMLLLDARGRTVRRSFRSPTPRPATPQAVVDAIAAMAIGMPRFERVSVGFPGPIVEGRVLFAANFDGEWDLFPLCSRIQRRLRVPVRIANDADIQGFGAIRGRGVELMITLGTGVGSALFVDGTLVPNVEVGHHPFRADQTYEQRLGMTGLETSGKRRWKKDLLDAIDELAHLFNYRRLYLGGGNARLIDFEVPDNVRIISNRAGLTGGLALWRDR